MHVLCRGHVAEHCGQFCLAAGQVLDQALGDGTQLTVGGLTGISQTGPDAVFENRQVTAEVKAENQLAGFTGTAGEVLGNHFGDSLLGGDGRAVSFQPGMVTLGRQAGYHQPPTLGRQRGEGDFAAALRNAEAGQRWRLQD